MTVAAGALCGLVCGGGGTAHVKRGRAEGGMAVADVCYLLLCVCGCRRGAC